MPKRKNTSSIKASFPVSKKSKVAVQQKKSATTKKTIPQKRATTTSSSASATKLVLSTDPPTCIFNHVGYTQKNQPGRVLAAGSAPQRTNGTTDEATKTLVSAKQKVVQYIEQRYNVPADFERPARFGPVSGSNYDDRLIHAYMRNKLALQQHGENQVLLGFPSTDQKIAECLDQGFDQKEAELMLSACGWVVKDALALLCDN